MIKLIMLSLICLSSQVEHCLIHHKICKECENGYYLVKRNLKNQYCMKISHCLSYGNKEETICYSCEVGYKLSEDKTKCELDTSFIKKDHCEFYDTIYNKCNGCEYGYAYYEGECIKFDGCESLSEPTKCRRCYNKYYYRLTKEGQCEFDICLRKGINGTCAECGDYFFRNETKQCEYIKIKYCRELYHGNRCDEWSGFFDVYGSYGDVTERKIFYESGCITHDGNYNCRECDRRYHYDEETKTCNFNCKVYDEDAPCEYCEYGYILVDNGKKCLQIINVEDENTEELEKNTAENSVEIIGENSGTNTTENSSEIVGENSGKNNEVNAGKVNDENTEKNYDEYIYLNFLINIIPIIILINL